MAVLGFLGASCGSSSSSKSTTAATTATTAATTTAATTATTTAATTAATTATTAAATTAAPTTAAATTAAPATTSAATTAGSGSAAVSGAITVFAASSLTDSFNQIATAFMTEYPNAKVTVNFGASSDLVTQIGQGAPADVFASADQANMTKVTTASENSGDPVVFAKNSLEIIVAAGNPKAITGVADLAKPDVIVVNCDPAVPIGAYSAQVLKNAGVTVTPKSLEQNVKGIVTKVTTGEADAGIVYKTDVTAAGSKAAGVVIPDNINVIAQYPIVALKAAPNAAGAQAFEAFVQSDQGQKILASYGFTAP
jgi:molybdate transport system substrate-binding protein